MSEEKIGGRLSVILESMIESGTKNLDTDNITNEKLQYLNKVVKNFENQRNLKDITDKNTLTGFFDAEINSKLVGADLVNKKKDEIIVRKDLITLTVGESIKKHLIFKRNEKEGIVRKKSIAEKINKAISSKIARTSTADIKARHQGTGPDDDTTISESTTRPHTGGSMHPLNRRQDFNKAYKNMSSLPKIPSRRNSIQEEEETAESKNLIVDMIKSYENFSRKSDCVLLDQHKKQQADTIRSEQFGYMHELDQSMLVHNYKRTVKLRKERQTDIRLAKACGPNVTSLFRERGKGKSRNKSVNVEKQDTEILQECERELDSDQFINFLKDFKRDDSEQLKLFFENFKQCCRLQDIANDEVDLAHILLQWVSVNNVHDLQTDLSLVQHFRAQLEKNQKELERRYTIGNVMRVMRRMRLSKFSIMDKI